MTLPVGRLLAPRSVAIVGASPREDTIGFRVIRNLRRLGFPGAIIPVNPRYPAVAGLACYPSLSDLPAPVDAAFIAVPNTGGPALVEEAGRAGIRAIVVNASGYADGGPEGQDLQRRLTDAARAHGIALAGPNNMGFVNVHGQTAMWTAARFPTLTPGPLAIISQSGSIAIALSQDERQLGIAYVVSAGNEAVLTAADYLAEIVRDDRVRVVAVFLETIRDPAGFLEAAAEARTRGKPVIALKVGRTEGGRAAVAAHTGALSGEDAVYDAFFERHGVVRVRDLDEMIEAATLFAAYPVPPPSRKLTVVTLSGGEAALSADLGTELGLEFPALSPSTLERVREAFPPFATPRNPVDAWGLGWDRDRFRRIVEALVDDPDLPTITFGIDATAGGGGDTSMMTDAAGTCVEIAARTDKRLVFFNNATGGGPNPGIRDVLRKAGIPYLAGMRPALAVLARWAAHGEWRLRAASSAAVPTPGHRPTPAAVDPRRLDEVARFRLLRDAGVPAVEVVAVHSADEAAAAAERLGYPVAVKASGADIAHKTDRGLVRLGVDGADALAVAFRDLTARAGPAVTVILQPMAGPGIELLVGVRNDPAFGSLTVVGLGGIHVELLRESAIRIGPVTPEDARAMLRATPAATLLAGVRGAGPFDLDAAVDAIVALSAFGAANQGVLAAVEVNPLIVLPRGRGAVAVDVLLESKGA
ncbi:MAG TPA: acetate--CoA ligase family protein [Candidatus Bathyarchaeia archaeon]|nr:acetate--CoA ligase family protein [Candidatus Bathyarchaeia archaeon]